jgi:hypothetical protein
MARSTAPTSPRPYRPLQHDERAARGTCPRCGDVHAAVMGQSGQVLVCRACGHVFSRQSAGSSGARR